MDRYAVVFFASPRNPTSDVISVSDITGAPVVGRTRKIRWNDGKQYKAKILYIGTKSECDRKAEHVTADGKIVEEFEVVPGTSLGSLSEDAASSLNEGGEENQALAELVTRVGELRAEMLPRRFENEFRSFKQQVTNQLREITSLNREILRRLPNQTANSSNPDTIEYTFVSQEKVEQLRSMRSGNISQFVLDLEKLVYGDNRDVLKHVENRLSTADRMQFIEKCVYKYYDVPVEARAATWKSAKIALNSRARKNRKKSASVTSAEPSREGSRDTNNDITDENDPFLFDDLDEN